jgi:D-sedoheptulose 7-phosphate isomerase
MNRIQQLQHNCPLAVDFARGYLEYLREVLALLDLEEIAAFASTLLAARERGARIFFIGNGGSAATASHFANDIAIGSRSWDKPFRALSLTDNVAIMTAIANDYGYERIFVLQLQTLMTPGDILVAISASGNSPNLVAAVEYANKSGATTIAITGFDGGQLRRIAGQCVHVPTSTGEYGPAEDVHLVLDHLVGAFLIHACRTQEVG